jgi:hypothetical protein
MNLLRTFNSTKESDVFVKVCVLGGITYLFFAFLFVLSLCKVAARAGRWEREILKDRSESGRVIPRTCVARMSRSRGDEHRSRQIVNYRALPREHISQHASSCSGNVARVCRTAKLGDRISVVSMRVRSTAEGEGPV